MPNQELWNIEHLPDILYQWKPTPADIKKGEIANRSYLIFGKVLRDIEVLPDRISSNIEPWLLQAWFRLESRIRWEDILDRIEPSVRPKWNTLNMDCVRFREDFHMRPWAASKGISTMARDELFESVLRKAGIDPARNTTRGLTPGLVNPGYVSSPASSRRTPVPEKWLKQRKQRKADVKPRCATDQTKMAKTARPAKSAVNILVKKATKQLSPKGAKKRALSEEGDSPESPSPKKQRTEEYQSLLNEVRSPSQKRNFETMDEVESRPSKRQLMDQAKEKLLRKPNFASVGKLEKQPSRHEAVGAAQMDGAATTPSRKRKAESVDVEEYFVVEPQKKMRLHSDVEYTGAAPMQGVGMEEAWQPQMQFDDITVSPSSPSFPSKAAADFFE